MKAFNYKAELIDKTGKVLSSFQEVSSKEFKLWKLDAIRHLSPKGQLVKFYINNEQEFANC